MTLKILFFMLFSSVAFLFASQNLTVYKKDNPASKIIGTLSFIDSIEELPIPPKKQKKVKYVYDKKKKQKKKVVKYVEVEQKEPPEYVPVKTKFGKGFVRRADLARFKEKASDLSGSYYSKTGVVILEKSPNFPGKFNVTILNGPENARAEIAAGNVTIKQYGPKSRFQYKEENCQIDLELFERKIQVVEHGCEEYHTEQFQFAGFYDRFEILKRKAESFKAPEQSFTFKKFVWCPEGPASCEKIRDEEDCSVKIVWSVNGSGMIERRCNESVHKYRPFERMIPGKKDFLNGEKPIMLKTKRTDMSSEWMVWYFYPKAERFKMIRLNTRPDIAYTEIYE